MTNPVMVPGPLGMVEESALRFSRLRRQRNLVTSALYRGVWEVAPGLGLGMAAEVSGFGMISFIFDPACSCGSPKHPLYPDVTCTGLIPGAKGTHTPMSVAQLPHGVTLRVSYWGSSFYWDREGPFPHEDALRGAWRTACLIQDHDVLREELCYQAFVDELSRITFPTRAYKPI